MNFASQKPVRTTSRSVHPLNKKHTTTADFFRWDVVTCRECVQNDVISCDIHSFIDGAPNPYPINGSMTYGQYAFFVPNRLVWEDWKYYIEELKSNLTKPYFTLGDLWTVYNDSTTPWYSFRKDARRFLSNINNLSSVLWVLDLSTFDNTSPYFNFKLDAMPLRMVQRLWWDWMRDKQNISDADESSYNVKTGGHISLAELTMLCAPKYRCYPKNYLTTCFDSPSADTDAGRIAVELPDTDLNPGLVQQTSAQGLLGLPLRQSVSSLPRSVSTSPDATTIPVGSTDVIGQTSVNDIRFKTSVQQYYERLLVAGKTVLSRALALFGVSPTIEELQMSNYLGGHEEELLFNTSASGVSSTVDPSDDPTANGAGPFGYNPQVATFAGQKHQNIISGNDGFNLNGISYKTDEAGYFFVMGCIMPRPSYYQGLPREWTYGLETFNHDVFDYFHSDMENQPMQPVLNYEVCAQQQVDPKGLYGFNEMYMHYKTTLDSVGGDFTDPSSQALFDKMNLGRDIYSVITLLALAYGGSVSDYLTPTVMIQASAYDEAWYDRFFTIMNENVDHFIINHKISVTMNRPMQSHCLPSLDSSLSSKTSKNLVDSGAFRL